MKLQTEPGQDVRQLFDPRRVGRFMNPEERRMDFLFQRAGNRLICGDHEFLDHSVGKVTFGFCDSFQKPFSVEGQFRFG